MASILWTIVAIVLVLWLLGFLLEFTIGGLIHLLLLVAVIAGAVAIVRAAMGKKV